MCRRSIKMGMMGIVGWISNNTGTNCSSTGCRNIIGSSCGSSIITSVGVVDCISCFMGFVMS